MEPIIPPALRPGDTIAIIPTARAISAAELRDGIALAESWGLNVRLGAGVGRKQFQQAGTDGERAADLQAAILDPDVKAIWCARGGYGTIRIMDELDLAPLRQHPKWLIGFSDVTVLHNALTALGVASLHGQMPFAIGAKSEETREGLRTVLSGKGEWRIAHGEWNEAPFTNDHSHIERLGQCEGILTGGNLSILYSLRGTRYDIDPRGRILFLEDLDELRYHADRMVQNLKYSGWFKDLAGLIIGGMSDMRDKDPDDPFGMEVEDMIAEVTAPYDYPVCYGFPAGHIPDNRPLVMGAKAKLSVTADGTTLSFEGIGAPGPSAT
ncbi:MAG: LD-carboxypeptidase [Bacteroidetes bacterium]|jgi:muramoyltetrapeptide carboxypeptidase|nr:LD-carboxypeptidase [Bacteroidota bacterium]MCC6655777.1 LD-carboxypeptidase [Flavobacteriales bacterium]HMU12358.1 LD-carboxypeptidase [Flavobacteriales bacterium]HMW95810.1 LD-carboxypeptidase [Flavobacteriales bacterium]HRT53613.1 LD-carboxypeptidase [Flavobacteriales bacterium]